MGKISMPQGRGSQMHNLREYAKYGRPVPESIDQSRTGENVILKHIPVREAYDKIFGEAVKEYNRRQTRSDRKICSYYDKILKSGNGEKPFYEDVIQWGKKEDFSDEMTRDLAAEALKQYAKSFERRNPNLKLIGAYLHMDEASPHLHLDYIPVATGYKRGLSVRNALDKALKQQGCVPSGREGKHSNSTLVWKKREREVFGKICRLYGLEVEAEKPTPDRKSLSVSEYKEARDKMLSEVAEERDKVQEEVHELEEKKTQARSELELYASSRKRLEHESEETAQAYDSAVKSAEEAVKSLTEEVDKTHAEYQSLKGDIEGDALQINYAMNSAKKTRDGRLKVLLYPEDHRAISWALEHAKLADSVRDLMTSLVKKAEALVRHAKELYKGAEEEKLAAQRDREEAERARSEAQKIASGEAYRDAKLEAESAKSSAATLKETTDLLVEKQTRLEREIRSLEAKRDQLTSSQYEHDFAQRYSRDFRDFVRQRRQEQSRQKNRGDLER